MLSTCTCIPNTLYGHKTGLDRRLGDARRLSCLGFGGQLARVGASRIAQMGCGASRERSVSVQQSGSSADDLVPIGLAAHNAQAAKAGGKGGVRPNEQEAPPPPLIFAGPTQADRDAMPPSPCCSERSLDMFEVAENVDTKTPTPVRKSKAQSYSPSAEEVEVRDPRRQHHRDTFRIEEQLLRGEMLLQEAQASLAAAGHRPLVQQPPSPSAERFASRLASRYPDRAATTARASAMVSPWKERTARAPTVLSPATRTSHSSRVARSGFRLDRAEAPAPVLSGVQHREPEVLLETAAATRQAEARKVQLELPNFDNEMDAIAQLEAMLHVGASTLQPPTRYHHEEAEQFRETLHADPVARVKSLAGAEAELDALMRREMELLDEGKDLLNVAEVEMARAIVESNDTDSPQQVQSAEYNFEPSDNRRAQRQRAVSTVVRELPDASRPRQALAPIEQGETRAGPASLPRVARSRRALAPLNHNAPATTVGGEDAKQPLKLGRRANQSRVSTHQHYGDENLIPGL
eukprot:COSAG02_NODE_684_length_18490_cov_14.283019_1_plen_521_part_00